MAGAPTRSTTRRAATTRADGICTHEEAHLADGLVIDDVIECPLHQGRFHIPSGKAKSPPVCVDLKTYPVKLEDGEIFIQLPARLRAMSGPARRLSSWAPATPAAARPSGCAAWATRRESDPARRRAPSALRAPAAFQGALDRRAGAPADCHLQDEAFYRDNGDRATARHAPQAALSPSGTKRLTLADGGDAGLRPAGARDRRPAPASWPARRRAGGRLLPARYRPFPRADRSTSSRAPALIVVGGGFIGLEVAASARKQGASRWSCSRPHPQVLGRGLPATGCRGHGRPACGRRRVGDPHRRPARRDRRRADRSARSRLTDGDAPGGLGGSDRYWHRSGRPSWRRSRRPALRRRHPSRRRLRDRGAGHPP